MTIGEIRALIKDLSVKYSFEKSEIKKKVIEKNIGEIIVLINDRLGAFASIADNSVLVDTDSLQKVIDNIQKYLQE